MSTPIVRLTRMGRPGQVGRASRTPWTVGEAVQLGVVTFSHAVQHVYVAALTLTYPYVVTEFGLSYGTLGILLGVAGMVGGLLQALAGLVRHISARVLLVAQNVGLTLATALAALAPSFAVFSLARMVGAFSSWPQHPVGSAHLAERFPHRRGFVLSWHTTGGSIGTFVVPLVAGGVIARFGWRWSLAGFAVAMLLGGALVGGGLREGRPATRDEQPATAADSGSGPVDAEGAATPETSAREGDLRLRTLLRRRTVVAVLLASTVAAAGRGLGAITTYVPAYLHSALDFDPWTVSFVFAVLVFGSIIGPVAVGYASDWLDRRRVLLTVYLIGAASLAGFVLVGAQLLAVVVFALLVGIFAYAESPVLQSLFSDATRGANSRTAFGAYFAIAYGIGALWLTAHGAIIDAAGFPAAFGTMAASFVVAAGVIAAVRPESAG